MCIRDSLFIRVAIGDHRRQGGHANGKAALRFGQKMDGVASVSYTHLRAHETVLDLVCRLLLEKQKEKAENDNIAHGHHSGTSKDTKGDNRQQNYVINGTH